MVYFLGRTWHSCFFGLFWLFLGHFYKILKDRVKVTFFHASRAFLAGDGALLHSTRGVESRAKQGWAILSSGPAALDSSLRRWKIKQNLNSLYKFLKDHTYILMGSGQPPIFCIYDP